MISFYQITEQKFIFVATRVKTKKKKKKKQSQGFDKQIRYTNGNWEAAKDIKFYQFLMGIKSSDMWYFAH